MSSPTLRAAGAFAALSAWLVLLMSGVTLGGAVYLLLALALVAFPWRAVKEPPDEAAGPAVGGREDGEGR
jgi:hypothetical protein